MDTSDIPTNQNGKIEIEGNEKRIKAKLKEITKSLTDKLQGKSTLNVEKLEIENADLENRIENETDIKKRRALKEKLSINNSKISNHKETEQLKVDNSIQHLRFQQVRLRNQVV